MTQIYETIPAPREHISDQEFSITQGRNVLKISTFIDKVSPLLYCANLTGKHILKCNPAKQMQSNICDGPLVQTLHNISARSLSELIRET